MTISEAKARFLANAQAEVGYYEKASNKDLDDPEANKGNKNFTKFARDVDSCTGWMNGNKQGYEWCCIFVCSISLYTFGYPTAREVLYMPTRALGAACKYAANYYKQHKAWTVKPEPGDQIFFMDSSGVMCHTGIVERVEGGLVHTIEGNAQNMVSRHSYMLGSGRIAGYGRPNWALAADEPEPSPAPKPEHSTLRKGSKGAEVVEMQEDLMSIGYELPKWGADGDFGSETEVAVCRFQKDHNLVMDGICGPLTWAALDEAVEAVSDQTGATVDPGDEVKYKVYTVKPGDTLIKIAVAHRTTAQALAFVNGIKNPSRIFVGQKIRIPV